MDENEVVVVETIEETPVETPEVSAEQKEKTVPLNKFLSEKQKRKDLERRLAELERKQTAEPVQRYVEKYKGLGMDEDFAKALAEDLAEMVGRAAKPTRDVIGEELDDLIVEHEFFDDAKAYEKEIREAIATGKASDVKTAYLLVRDPDSRAREIANRGNAPKATKAQPVSKPAEPKSDALTAEERADLDELQKVQPWANWNADSYKKYMRNR